MSQSSFVFQPSHSINPRLRRHDIAQSEVTREEAQLHPCKFTYTYVHKNVHTYEHISASAAESNGRKPTSISSHTGQYVHGSRVRQHSVDPTPNMHHPMSVENNRVGQNKTGNSPEPVYKTIQYAFRWELHAAKALKINKYIGMTNLTVPAIFSARPRSRRSRDAVSWAERLPLLHPYPRKSNKKSHQKKSRSRTPKPKQRTRKNGVARAPRRIVRRMSR